jgi:hypothetical protein
LVPIAGKISVLVDGDRRPAIEFLEGLVDATQRRFTHLFVETMEHGPPKGHERFRHLGDQIYEFKTHDGYRMYCFLVAAEKHVILTHGSKKEKPRVLRNQIVRAVQMRAQYFSDLEDRI